MKFPIAEIFGPTIQGEGIDQGQPCYFVRFGGCDYKCDWCDTPHAVLPENVKHLGRMTEDQILDALEALPRGPGLVILSGGNPALYELGGLCKRIRARGLRVSVETQGSRYKDWLRDVNRLCLSPKPPSSGMTFSEPVFYDLLQKVVDRRRYDDVWTGNIFVKIVVFDLTDYEWALHMRNQISEWTSGIGFPFYLSAGNDAGKTVGNPGRDDQRSLEQIRSDLLARYLWLINRVMVDPRWGGDVIVQAQSHVLAWGNKQGV